MNSEKYPVVSIGLPAYNCEKTLAIAIRSILNQTFENWELLVLDDGSTDQTLEVIRSFFDPRIRVITDGQHRGLVARLNQAIEESSGRYFARMDGDDVAFPERLGCQVAFLEENRGIDVVGCGVLVFTTGGSVLGARRICQTHAEICRRPWAGFQLPHPTWMGRIEWFRTHRYDARAIRAEDQELLLRSYSTSQFACLPEFLQGYQESSLSIRKILRGRYSFTLAVFREFFWRGKVLTAMGGVAEQCAKALVDIFAISTGLNYRVLRHRARPAERELMQRWAEILRQLEADTRQTLSST